ncbi:MAG: twin-arginine translocase TatA/TatE family subunit [Dehalococcoidia bacterium]|nr:twin-arginine translocase TatA/TatE family subunit [Dehalococcoidia bacterium]
MFRSFGIPELLLVLVIVLLVFGAARLPQIGEALGKAIRNFRKGASGEGDKDKTNNLSKADAGAADKDDSKT